MKYIALASAIVLLFSDLSLFGWPALAWALFLHIVEQTDGELGS